MNNFLSKHDFKSFFRISILMGTASQLFYPYNAESKDPQAAVLQENSASVAEMPKMPEMKKAKAQSHPLKKQHPHADIKMTAQEKSMDQSLRTVIAEALKNNPTLNADKAAEIESRYRLDQANAGYFPTLDGSGSYGYGYLKDKFRSTKLNQGVSGTVVNDTGDLTITARQMIFDGMDTPNKVLKGEKEKYQAEKKIHETLELIAFQALREYFTILRFQELVRLAENNIANHRSVLGKVQTLKNSGKSTLSDVQHVESRLADAEAARQDIIGDLESSKARFMEITGHEPSNLIAERIDYTILPPTLEAALKMADKNNRSLEVARASVEVAKADLKTTETPFYPSLGLEGSAQRSFNPLGESGSQNTMTAKAVMRYNIFNGGRDVSRQKEYIARLTGAKYKLEAERRRTDREVRISKAVLDSALKQLKALQNAAGTKQEVLGTFKQQFDLGNRSFLEILDAAHDSFLAQGGKITAAAAADVAAIRYLATLGILAETYGWSKMHRAGHVHTKPMHHHHHSVKHSHPGQASTAVTAVPDLSPVKTPVSSAAPQSDARTAKGIRSVY